MEADYFVGTCSSNLGRLIYQLRMAKDPMKGDTTTACLDMDWHHYFFHKTLVYKVMLLNGGRNLLLSNAYRSLKAVSANTGSPEDRALSFREGDVIEAAEVKDLYRVWRSIKRSFLPDGITYGRMRLGGGEAGWATTVGAFPKFKVKWDSAAVFRSE